MIFDTGFGWHQTITHPQNQVSGVNHHLTIKAQIFSEDRLTTALICKIFMATFTVHVTIENKPGISDPEGDTILMTWFSKVHTKQYQKSKLPKCSSSQLKKKTRKLQKKRFKKFATILEFTIRW